MCSISLKPLRLFFLISLFLGVERSYAQFDLTGNGVPDLILTQAEQDGQLRWIAQDLETLDTKDLGLFGQAGYQSSMGAWLKKDTPSRAYITRDRFGQFMLFVEGINEVITIGQSRKKSSIFLGRDSDGSGISDVTFVNGNREKLWSWIFSFDPVGEATSNRRILFGHKNEMPFLFKKRGKTDSLAALRFRGTRADIQYRSLQGKLIRTIRLNGFPVPKVRPIAFKSNVDGRDTLAFRTTTTNQAVNLITVNQRGRKENSIIIPAGFYPLVGDFNGDGIEDVSLVSSKQVILSDKREIPILVKDATPVDASGAQDYEQEEISATPTSTFTNTSIFTVTTTYTLAPTVTLPPTSTSTLTPIAPVTPYPTYTLYPTFTNTFTPTVTSTATATFTPTSTYTHTYTLTPTATPTPTNTSTSTHTPTLGPAAFSQVAHVLGVADTGNGVGVAWGDYDGDSDLDLYLANNGSANRLFLFCHSSREGVS